MAFWNKKDDQDLQKQSLEASKSSDLKTPEVTTETDKQRIPGIPLAAPASSSKHEGVRSALAKGTVIQGKLSFDTPVRIDGKLSGEVYSTETVIIGSAGEIDAKIEVKNLIIMGKVSGTISASTKVEILKEGEVDAEVFTKSITMEEGAIFNGSCSMGTEKVTAIKETASKETKAKTGAQQPEVRVH